MNLLIAACLLWQQTNAKPGELILNDQVTVRIIAVGDFLNWKRAPWAADGKPLTPEVLKRLQQFEREYDVKRDADKRSLRNPSDIGRYLLVETTFPKDWLVSGQFSAPGWSGTAEGESKDTEDSWMAFLSLQPGTKAYRYPLYISSHKSTPLYDLPEDGQVQIEDMAITVEHRQEAAIMASKTERKEHPVTHYKVIINMPKSKFDEALDLDVYNNPPFQSSGDKDFDKNLKMEDGRHGIEGVKEIGNARVEVTFFAHVLGVASPDTKLRVVRKQIWRPMIEVAMEPIK